MRTGCWLLEGRESEKANKPNSRIEEAKEAWAGRFWHTMSTGHVMAVLAVLQCPERA